MASNNGFDLRLIRGRMQLISALRAHLESADFTEVQTPLLQSHLSGFETGTGFSTYSASLGERLWFRAAPELYLKRLLVEGREAGLERVFELAVCARDELDEQAPREGFDRPEFTLLELYTVADDPDSLEGLLRELVEQGVARLEAKGLLPQEAADAVSRLRGPWERRRYSDLLRTVDADFDLDALLSRSRSGNSALAQAEAIESRASDPVLREAATRLAYLSGGLAPYLRVGPHGYWYDFVEHAFRTRVAPTLKGPVIIEGLPLESSPLAQSEDGVHCRKWELYVDGLRVALAQRELMDADAQRVRFQHLDRLRRLGYDLLPEPDESFVKELEHWPSDQSLIGMGVYVDRLAGAVFGLLNDAGKGQERMLPHLFKSYLG
jgi:lysyl-tRNA synthetase class 2